MRLILASLIVTIAMQSATAQLFSPESMNGALLGMFIGGAVGSDHHCEWSGEGAAIIACAPSRSLVIRPALKMGSPIDGDADQG